MPGAEGNRRNASRRGPTPVPVPPPASAPVILLPDEPPAAPPARPIIVTSAPRPVPARPKPADESPAPVFLDRDTAFSAMISGVFHFVLFIVLALFVSVALPRGGPINLMASDTPDTEVAIASQDHVVPVMLPTALETAAPSSAFVAESSIPVPAVPDRLAIALSPSADKVIPLPDRPRRESRKAGKTAPPGPDTAAQPRMAQAGSGEQALNGVLGEVGARAGKQDLLVVWLIDASLSLRNDRQMIATRLADFFRQQDALPDGKKHLLMNAAVAFGANTVELEPPTRFSKKIVDAIARVPNDLTGVENPFAAVRWAVERYGKRQSGVMLVIWTDESGDDQQEIEAAVQACSKYRASVSVVGPTSVLGRLYGRQSWNDGAGTSFLLLPVNRGPDSPAIERLQLPYWFEAQVPFGRDSTQAGHLELQPWYGGPQLDWLLCGLGPYALVRLTMATGGTYTLLDRPADRCPFQLDLMQPYLPSYRPLKEYLAELRYRPLRQAVISAVQCTLAEPNWLPPSTEFRAAQAAAFKDEFAGAQAQARRSLLIVQKALAALGARNGMEEQYAEETSPRWRAWYDLTRGRLLACLVRYNQYDLACTLLQQRGVINSATNRIILFPSATLRGPSVIQAPAAEAERLLKRCVEKNAKTPWAFLADRELLYPLGIDFQQDVVPPSPKREPRNGGQRPARPPATPAPLL